MHIPVASPFQSSPVHPPYCSLNLNPPTIAPPQLDYYTEIAMTVYVENVLILLTIHKCTHHPPVPCVHSKATESSMDKLLLHRNSKYIVVPLHVMHVTVYEDSVELMLLCKISVHNAIQTPHWVGW